MPEYSEIDAIHQDFRKSKEEDTKVFNKIPPNMKVLFVIAICVVIWWFMIANKEWKTGALIVVGLLAAMYLWGAGDVGGRRELTDLELRTLLWKQLKYYQINAFGSHYVIPDGEIKLMANVARWSVDEQVKYRTYGVEIIKRNGLKDFYAMDVNIYTGDIVKIEESYFSGKQRPHIKYIESEDVARKRRYDEIVNTGKKQVGG